MLGAYREMLKRVERVGRGLGFKLIRDEDFLATLRRADGWSLSLEGDRVAYPGFTLFVESPARKGAQGIYAIWVLMECFKLPDDRKRPSLDNQLWFLEQFASQIFKDEAMYKSDYDRLNGSE